MRKGIIKSLSLSASIIFIIIIIIFISCEEENKQLEANFTVDKTTVLINEKIQFTDLTKNNPKNWNWDFGDETYSTLQNPEHQYKYRGNYTIKLSTSVSSTNGDSEIKENYITVNAITSSFIDSRDNTTYNTVKIGNQWWMSENLNYNSVSSSAYMNNEEYASTYGRLYYYQDAVNACPDGWHLPQKSEWEALINAAGSEPGKVLKSDSLWRESSNNTNGTGFTALPGGYFVSGYFGIEEYAYFWTSTLESNYYPVYFCLYYFGNSYQIDHYIDTDPNTNLLKFYIRCVKD